MISYPIFRVMKRRAFITQTILLVALLSILTYRILLIGPPALEYLGLSPLVGSTSGCACLTETSLDSGAVPARAMELESGHSESCLLAEIPDADVLPALEVSKDADIQALSKLPVVLESGDKSDLLFPQITWFGQPQYENNHPWREVRYHVPSEFNSAGPLSLKLDCSRVEKNLGPPIFVRPLVHFYRSSAYSDLVSSLKHPGLLAVLVSCCAAALIILVIARARLESLSYGKFFLLLVALTVFVHLRFSPYLYWDEWHVLERLSLDGLGYAFTAHGEHFIPLFFFIYAVQVWLFGDLYVCYLLLSCLLLSTCGFLLSLLLERTVKCCGYEKPVTKASRILSIFYVLNSLHSEAMHWAFVQCVLLEEVLVILGLLAVLSFIKEGRVLALVLVSACCFLSPLSFANGFSLPLQIGLLFLAHSVCHSKWDRDYFGCCPQVLINWLKSGLALCAAIAIGTGSSALLYALNTKRVGHGISEANLWGHLDAVLRYVFVGTQLGTVLRGLSFWVGLALESPAQALSRFLPVGFSAEVTLASAGLGISLLLLLLGLLLLPKNRLWTLGIWSLGQLFMFSAMLLPALGRWQFGLVQSLSLRYQSLALIGLVIVLLPISLGMLNRQRTLTLTFNLLLWLVVSVQLWMGSRFDYFTGKGIANREFVGKLVLWKEALDASGPGNASQSYEGQATAIEGLYPVMPSELTPAKRPDDIYSTIKYLNGNRSTGCVVDK